MRGVCIVSHVGQAKSDVVFIESDIGFNGSGIGFAESHPVLAIKLLLQGGRWRGFLLFTPQFHPSDFTADGFGQCIHKLDDAGILIGSSYLFNVCLYFFD